ncbi:cytochrome P450 [Trametes meyenii]|nr:cytochrome P450 [Trametes meyenii]
MVELLASSYPSPYISLTVLFLVTILCYALLKPTGHQRYPPGPPGNFLFGNILQVAPHGPWVKFTEYKDLYGDLVYFHGLGNNLLVLNSPQAINDLLERKGRIYSDRPHFTVAGDLMGLGQSMPLLPLGPEWRAQRKLAHVSLSPSAVRKYYTVQEDLAALLSKRLLDTPLDFFNHSRLTASRLILTMTYGLSINAADNEYISHADQTMRMISQSTVPGAFMCDYLPWMRHLPSWLPFHRKAAKGKMMIEHLVTKPLLHVKKEMAAGTAPPSLTQELLSMNRDDFPMLEHHVKWATGSLYGGGCLTHALVIIAIMAMTFYPEVLKEAHEELDRVIGTERMPRLSDQPNLPYIRALIKETMRWHPTLPLSIPRCTAAEDEYRGYTIPKGTTILPNLWAIAFSPIGPYDPSKFEPERFLVTDPNDMPPDPYDWAFGFARRLCPGKYLAENSLFILVSTILAMFDIAPPPGGTVRAEFTDDLVSHPKPFECRITPRSASKAAQINWRAAQCTT